MGTEEGVDTPQVNEAQVQEEHDFRDFVGVEHDAEKDSSWDNKRFRQVYRRYKDGERNTEQMRNDIKLMSEHNRKLAEAAEKITSSTQKIVESQVQKAVDTGQAEIEKMETDIRDLKTARKAARTEADWDKVDVLDEQIQRLNTRIDRKKDDLEKKATAEKEKPKPPAEDRPDTKAIKEFVQETAWFNSESDDFDPVMTSAAKEYDTALMNKPKYKGKIELTAERLKEVAAYIEKRFEWKKKAEKPTPQSKVEGVENERGENQNKGKRTLSAEEKRVAHNMMPDIDPAKAEVEYLKQLKIIEEG